MNDKNNAKQKRNIRRLAIYTFWEKNGNVRGYVYNYLECLLEVCEKVIVVANGGVKPSDAIKLKQMGILCLERPNFGLDFSAWKYAIEYLTYDHIETYDELVLSNCSVYGPIFPIADLFAEMEHRNFDFWGITKVPEDRSSCLIKGNDDSYIRTHIQSYFIVITNRVLKSQAFKNWWCNLIPSKSFMEEVYQHETKFTEYFEKAGFVSGAYYKSQFKWNPTIFEAEVLLYFKVPFIKRKLFTLHHNSIVDKISVDVLTYLKKNNISNYRLIFEDLIGNKSEKIVLRNIKYYWLIEYKVKFTLYRYKLLSIFSKSYRLKFNSLQNALNYNKFG